MVNVNVSALRPQASKKDADYVFYELTRSICPVCRRVIDAHVVIRDNKVYMRKRCSDHGPFRKKCALCLSVGSFVRILFYNHAQRCLL